MTCVWLRYFLIACAVVCLLTEFACATPANRQAFLRYLGKFQSERLDSCAVCHVRAKPDGAESLDEFPHNAFGDRLRVLGEKTKATFRDRLITIAKEDSDGDGVSNLREFLAGTLPGNKEDQPAKDSSDRLEKLLVEFTEYSNRYVWEPFKPVVQPTIPQVKSEAWGKNSIDKFVAAQHESRGLVPQQPAAAEVLLRRVYLDLIGLSPTADEVRNFTAAFENDPKAYENVVDRLLDDPAYGERWGRHWMDVWRYSDWAGYKDALRDSQRHIWHWRDWIIESLNKDKPYDRMLIEMLAADELVPEDTDAIRATGYLARQYFRDRDQWMDNVVKHSSQGFLGITVGCAKCHDHMYDPITQREYYSMRAIFERYSVRTDRVPGVLDTMKGGIPRAYDNTLVVNTWFLEAGDERRPVKDDPIPAGVPASLGGTFEPQQVSLPRFATKPDRRDFVRADLLAAAQKSVVAAKDDKTKQAAESKVAVLQAQFEIEDLEDNGGKDTDEWTSQAKALFELQRQSALFDAQAKMEAAEAALTKATESLAKAKADKDKAAKSKATKALAAAKKNIAPAKKALDAARKATEAEVTTKYAPRKQSTYLNKSNGSRLAFARWVTANENPLAARVAVNHIWLRHFGQGIVPTPNEFGGNGREPSHPALLDWLAAEFMNQGWSMKKLHKMIVMSATYGMSSRSHADNRTIDPDNRFLWRVSTKRMEGEIVRDNLLHASGRLDRKMGGPDIDNKLAQKSTRRSVYLRHAHEKLVEFVQIFDGPSVSECYMRETSVKPHQALAMANSPLTVHGSRKLAATIHEKTKGDSKLFIEEAYLTILSRQPLESEAALCRKFLKAESEAVTLDRCEKLITVLFNHNDFVAIR